MMMWIIGVALFALFILVSVALHECGHMWAARATGMKVRRYFVGFGPTLWSTRRPNKLGYTEYGVKAVPLGGFCDIAGMTAIDEIAPEDERYAMYKQKTWKRVVVLFAGPAMNFVIGSGADLRDGAVLGASEPASATRRIRQRNLLRRTGNQQGADGQVRRGRTRGGGGHQGGRHHRQGRRHRRAQPRRDGGRGAKADRACAVRHRAAEGGTTTGITTMVDVTRTQRWTSDTAQAPSTVAAVGISAAEFGPVKYAQYNPLTAIPGTVAFTGDLAVELGKSLAKIPTKVGALVHSIGGGERDPETPISVVGASIIGGDAFEHGYFMAFWFFLAQLNFVLGAINLLPLLPFDGGHIAVALFEKIRNMIRKARGMVAAAPVNYLKLMPATYVILVVVVGYMALTVTADFVNPIRPFQ